MFWPTGKHQFGWFLEPAYDYSFPGGHQQSIGMSAVLLIGIRRSSDRPNPNSSMCGTIVISTYVERPNTLVNSHLFRDQLD